MKNQIPRISAALRWVASFVVVTAVLFWAGDRLFRPISVDDTGVHFYDFPYYLLLARGFWFEGYTNFYAAPDNFAVLTAHLGATPDGLMAPAWSPIFLLFALPFCWLSLASLMLAHTAWVALSLLAVAGAFRSLVRREPPLSSRATLPLFTGLGVAAGSLSGLGALLIGQMAPVAIAALTVLIAECWSADRAEHRPRLGVCIFCLLVLSVKPSYLGLGAALLLIKGQWRVALLGLAACAAPVVAFSLALGPDWTRSYGAALRIFGQAEIPAPYRLAFQFELMNIFRSAFAPLAPAAVLVACSNLVVVAAFATVTGYGLLRLLRPSRVTLVTDDQLYAALVGSYLLFAPFVGFYEDLLLLTVWGMAARTGALPPLRSWRFAAIVACAWLTFNFFLARSPGARTLFWLAKLAEAALLASVLGGRREPGAVITAVERIA